MTELGLILGIALAGLAFAGLMARWVLSRPVGDAEMARVSTKIRLAAEGFFKRQSGTIGALSAAGGGAIFLAYGLRESRADPVSGMELGVWLTLSFAVGAASSVAAGHVATWIATRTNVRVAHGARRSLDQALQVAVRGGAVLGLFVAASSQLGLGLLFAAVILVRGGLDDPEALRLVPTIPMLIVGYALGASFAALLAQLGGGIFSKAADLGADVAGHEVGLPEDDAQNPASIADLAGDNVGDCAGRGAGIFQATVAENLGAMLIGAAVFRHNDDLPSALAITLFPLVTRAFGVIGAMFGVMVVRTDDREDPLNALARGLYVTTLLHVVGIAGAAKWLLAEHWLLIFGCGAVGSLTGVLFLAVTQYYTEQRFRPVRELAEGSRAGSTLTVLSGMGIGLESTVVPSVLVVAAAAAAYALGAMTGLELGGLYGVSVATMGMLGTAGYVLSVDAFGPIVDNAGGIIQMTVGRERPDVLGRTAVLDAVGNTVKALTKSYAAGAAGLSSLLLISAYLEEAGRRGRELGQAVHVPRIDAPEMFFGAMLGVVLVVWLTARCVGGVTRSARRVIDEVRRQLRDRPLSRASGAVSERPRDSRSSVEPGARTGPPEAGLDPEACTEMAARFALRHMILPAVVVTVVPVLLGLGLRLATTEDNPLLAANTVAALIMAATIAGVLGSLLLGNAGGAWDNAKRYILTGAHGGRTLVDETGARTENPTYLAAATGDTVGDPLKDAAAPAIHVLVKLLPVLMLVFLPFFL